MSTPVETVAEYDRESEAAEALLLGRRPQPPPDRRRSGALYRSNQSSHWLESPGFSRGEELNDWVSAIDQVPFSPVRVDRTQAAGYATF